MKNTKFLHGCNIPRGLILLVLTVEYIIIFFDVRSLACSSAYTLGYFMLTAFITCNNHSPNVHLAYEQELSMFMKGAVTELTMSAFLVAWMRAVPGAEITLSRIVFMVVLHMATMVVLIFLGQRWEVHSNHSRILYIYEKHKPDGVPSEDQICVSAGSAEIRERMKYYSAVYLYELSLELRDPYLKVCFEMRKPAYFTAVLSDEELRVSQLAQDGETPILYCERYIISYRQRLVKRLFDAFFSALLLVLLSPLLFITAICIKLEDGGPVFYRQIRCTEGLRSFKMLKFRSMIEHAEEKEGPRLADLQDERVTKVGRIIRRFKIDELPQLVNILKGDMSFVGPRPERPELVKKAFVDLPEFEYRNAMKAGLTGYAQVHGDYHTDNGNKLKWDWLYIENYSFLLDLKIILMTIPIVLRGTGDMVNTEGIETK